MGSLHSPTTLEVVIIGGSISGLMCGIALKHAGHNIQILEQDQDVRQSHMAGICLGRDVQRFLQLHDRVSHPFTINSNKILLLNQNAEKLLLVNVQRVVSSWDALYYRLRANFDAYRSTYYQNPPVARAGYGKAVYSSGKMVLNIQNMKNDARMEVTVKDTATKKITRVHADIVIGADGPNSFVRRKYLPSCSRKYAGYIVWRGVVAESEVSPKTLETFSKNVTVFMKSRQHCLVYVIPGPHGSLQPGQRYLNFALADAETGHRHRNTVPSGRVREDVWIKQLQNAIETPLPPPFLDVISQIRIPFIQVITEVSSPRVMFEEGKVLLIGDGLSLIRPHTAFSASQAAFHTLTLADCLAQGLDMLEWEKTVLRFGYLHNVQSWWFGNFYQGNITCISALCYWFLCIADVIGSWWTNRERLLRTT
ncbi:FAD/NAD(P)-binding domain-containing protein [Melanomma pulvis-pyrius CBS 109.77]|uniref:FAD/NAD(P)-binding domain-containing protein n=1 Tax=Melanomma pulvis-pyrius CBS 109.77 TaxID=1314802 RepID=A0A6A6WXA4_9PLEO|nr:FAD/NAD(P)-binding domain-containing protein [Melanomma pulvis-pyrius CBS 109.77]